MTFTKKYFIRIEKSKTVTKVKLVTKIKKLRKLSFILELWYYHQIVVVQIRIKYGLLSKQWLQGKQQNGSNASFSWKVMPSSYHTE